MMTDLNVISEEPVTMAQLRDDLKKIHKKEEELNLRANKTLEYLNMFVTIKGSEAKELYGKVEALDIPRFKPEHIVKIIDILPASVEELKTVMSGFSITITNENCKKIVDVVAEYLPKK
jgi:DNA-directed RNA polymerase subunit F